MGNGLSKGSFGSTVLRAGLWCAAAVCLCCEAWAWNLDPWDMLPSKSNSYAVYNMSQHPVVVYHQRTGARYIWGPGHLGYPSLNGVKLSYRPVELTIAPEDPSLQCTVKLVNYDYEPTLVIEVGNAQIPSYPGVACRASAPPPAALKGVRKVAPVEGLPADAPRPSPGPAPVDPSTRLRSFMERMIHIYIRFSGPEQVARLNELKAGHRDVTDGRAYSQLAADLVQYEALCKCVHSYRLKGMSPEEIYGMKLCGPLSTREARNAVLARVQAALR